MQTYFSIIIQFIERFHFRMQNQIIHQHLNAVIFFEIKFWIRLQVQKWTESNFYCPFPNEVLNMYLSAKCKNVATSFFDIWSSIRIFFSKAVVIHVKYISSVPFSEITRNSWTRSSIIFWWPGDHGLRSQTKTTLDQIFRKSKPLKFPVNKARQ